MVEVGCWICRFIEHSSGKWAVYRFTLDFSFHLLDVHVHCINRFDAHITIYSTCVRFAAHMSVREIAIADVINRWKWTNFAGTAYVTNFNRDWSFGHFACSVCHGSRSDVHGKSEWIISRLCVAGDLIIDKFANCLIIFVITYSLHIKTIEILW